jgi:small GTP-binding protein
MTSSDKDNMVAKILTIGESGVGKTCILLRYTDNKFIKHHLTTIGIDYKTKDVNINGKSIKLKIWDTAGQERFRNITQQYYKGADGIVLVFDLTDRNSFEKIREWMKQIQSYTQRESIAIVLLGNKCDADNKAVSAKEANDIATEYNMKFFETSAMNNINIEESFKQLSTEIMKIKESKNARADATPQNQSQQLKPVDKGEKKEKKKGCC